ncbi:hypothetical protein BJV74DRAFT_443849 [Russula compacta]|nr:hypothetical protein BJV74DRAFT_443849 [Russula compacta]
MPISSPLAAACLALAFSRTVFSALYVVSPTAQTVCHGGQPCAVQWLDDGEEPLLTAMGPCYVALYTGNEMLIQQIEPVDVSINHSLTFTPSPDAGSNSDTYYIAFTSISSPNSSDPLQAFSATFSLDRMSGSFDSQVPELTSMIPVPSSVLSAHPHPISTSLLSGSLSTTMTLSSSSGSISGPSSTSPSDSATPSRSNAATRQSSRLWVIALVGLSISFLL